MVLASKDGNNWFRLDRVDELERRTLPEFFDGKSASKTPTSYTRMRNLIVTTYRESPGVHLSVTECRRHLAADVGSVVRLHQFLEHWGIINSVSDERKAAAGTLEPRSGGGGATSVRSTLPMKPTAAGVWSPSETLQLIEALEAVNPGGDPSWDDIATQLGRRTEECICHFLALPIAEPYTLAASTPAAAEGGDGGAEADATGAATASAAATPSDPMLTQLAVLAAHVLPGGGAAANGNSSADAKSISAAREAMGRVHANALAKRTEESAAMATLLGSAVDLQLQKLEMKLSHVDELTSLLHREREQLERLRHTVLAERLTLETRRAQPPRYEPPVPMAAAHLAAAGAATGAS